MTQPKARYRTSDNRRLDEIRARAEAATPGPWRWRGNMDHSDPRLQAPRRDVLGHVPRERSMNDREAQQHIDYLLDCVRVPDDQGGFRAMTQEEAEERVRDEWLEDSYGEVRRDERLGFVNEHLIYDYARDLAIYEVCPEATSRSDRRVYRADIIGIRHPDAEFIAHSREDIDALLAEVDRLRAVERYAREVMWALEEHGPAIVGHLLDDDENSGERLRQALGMWCCESLRRMGTCSCPDAETLAGLTGGSDGQ